MKDTTTDSLMQLTDAVLKNDIRTVDTLLNDNPELALTKLDAIDPSRAYPVEQTIMHIVGMGDNT